MNIIPFHQCIARPDEGEQRCLLKEHLEAVAAGCGRCEGAPAERLAFLAGLLHDAAKGNAEWQDYISGNRPKGPPHAPLGAALFAYCAEALIPVWSEDKGVRTQLRDLALDWTRVVYDHHGKLDDLDTVPPWDCASPGATLDGLLQNCDTDGLLHFVTAHFPDLAIDLATFGEWLEQFPMKWERRYRHRPPSPTHPVTSAPLRLPHIAASLVCSDRYHAGGFERTSLDPDAAGVAIERLAEQCRQRAEAAIAEGAAPELVAARARVQDAALTTYRSHCDGGFFTLLLPTGYGKTLTGLRVALEACRSGRCSRVVYVAPYLSILSQAAQEMSTTTGIEVFQHHHLSLLDMVDDMDIHRVDILDTWQTPILATTFNQFFRALFPERAQECVRIEALRGAFIFIDEPQIIDTAVWNLFLRTLAPACRDWNCQVLFSTATLPLLEIGLGTTPAPLAPPVEPPRRYVLESSTEPLTAAALAEQVVALHLAGESVAVLLNTVADAAAVHALLANGEGVRPLHCLTALMLPAHKAAVIRSIREQLHAGLPVVAVCTQVLEAGVDLSFRHILRALPIFPSIAQAAGRANRHGEGDRARVSVFPFVRDEGTDARRWVYRDATARRQTDALLRERPTLPEEEVGEALKTWFHRCWVEQRGEACLQKLEDAARGQWSALAGLEPFGAGPPREEVFVPADDLELTPGMQRLMQKFAPDGPEQLLRRCFDRDFRRTLDFVQRKRLMALLRQFLVPVGKKVADQVANPVDGSDWLWRVGKVEDYSASTGFAHWMVGEAADASCII